MSTDLEQHLLETREDDIKEPKEFPTMNKDDRTGTNFLENYFDPK